MTNGNLRSIFIKGKGMERTTPTPDMYIMSSSPHSPTDSSEDSVEVKVEAILARSKRKSNEPRKISECGPLKKRICLRNSEEDAATVVTPFRPWNTQPAVHQYFRPPSPMPQPVDLKKVPCEPSPSVSLEDAQPRVPIHPDPMDAVQEMENVLSTSMDNFPKLRKEQRNYKNMTRERRIEANARERTRVHTISAAFDTLRRSVPAYSHSQKLSKLSVLRIACSYIESLANILDDSPETSTSIQAVTNTIQREGKIRKKKDDD
ncbi:PREDICTED: protein atonal homolog 8 [Nicrophorus vespilloides]|uniref:Protein atonal homolog 8 n=1 Tax=Nicrophorus vespilloides TaxID=110193 RepID=A0ABM1N389_NICVS|nr:PREDICTED: protein atonal homolog 8 [Nicrophorus vespilloides]